MIDLIGQVWAIMGGGPESFFWCLLGYVVVRHSLLPFIIAAVGVGRPTPPFCTIPLMGVDDDDMMVVVVDDDRRVPCWPM